MTAPGLKRTAVQTKAVTDTISKVHWQYGRKPHKVKGGSFIVRFDRQGSFDTIYSNLPKLRDYMDQLPGGTKNHVSAKRDQIKAQTGQEASITYEPSILKNKGTDTKVRSVGRGYYLLTEHKHKH